MIAYESMGLINFSGVFPNTSAINATSAGATNGTPLMAVWLNDEWAFWQSILFLAQQMPSGVSEACPASATAALGAAQQKIQSLEMKFGAPGELVFDFITPGSGTYPNGGAQAMTWGASTGGPPTRYQYRRVLPLQNQRVLIASYPDLCAALYCGDGSNATADYCYKSTDSGGVTHSTSGTYFTLPDCRGLTLRGIDWTKAHDPLGDIRGVGNAHGLLASLQQDAFQGHWHNAKTDTALGAGGLSAIRPPGASTDSSTVKDPVTDSVNGTPRTDKETRMYNFSCNIGVRY